MRRLTACLLKVGAVLILAGVAFFAAWQPSQLAQQNRALQAELTQRTSELSTQTTRLTALHDMAQSLGSPLRMECPAHHHAR